MSSFSTFGTAVPTSPAAEGPTGRRASVLFDGRLLPGTPASSAVPTGSDEADELQKWREIIKLTIKESCGTLTKDFLNESMVSLFEDTMDNKPKTSELMAMDIPQKFSKIVLNKLNKLVFVDLAEQLAAAMAAKNAEIHALVLQLEALSAADTVVPEDALSSMEKTSREMSKGCYDKAMAELLVAHLRNKHSTENLLVLNSSLEIYEYRSDMEVRIESCYGDEDKKRELRVEMLAANCSNTLTDTGIDSVKTEIKSLRERIEAAEKATVRFDKSMKVVLRTIQLTPETQDVQLSKVIFEPESKCFLWEKPDPQHGRAWQTEILSILNQCPTRFWCIAPTVVRMFESQHYTGVGWRPKGIDKDYSHICDDLRVVYAAQSKDLYSLLKKKMPEHVSTSTQKPITNLLIIGNLTSEGESQWKSRAVELDGVAVCEYWAHLHESKGKIMRETLRSFFEKTAELEISSSTKLSDAFDHIEKQFAMVRSYGSPVGFRVSHSKSLTKMSIALSMRGGAFGAVCAQHKDPSSVENEQFCFMAMQDFISEATSVLVSLPSTDVIIAPTTVQRALYASAKNDSNYPIFSGHTQGGGDKGKVGKGGHGKSTGSQADHSSTRFTCSACDKSGNPCTRKIEESTQKSLSLSNKGHSALCSKCFKMLRENKRLLVRSKDQSKPPWVREWQESKGGRDNHKHGKNNNDRKVTRAYFVKHFEDIEIKYIKELPSDDGDDDSQSESRFSAMSNETSELLDFRAQRKALADQKAMATAAAAAKPTDRDILNAQSEAIMSLLKMQAMATATNGDTAAAGNPTPASSTSDMIAKLSELMLHQPDSQ